MNRKSIQRIVEFVLDGEMGKDQVDESGNEADDGCGPRVVAVASGTHGHHS